MHQEQRVLATGRAGCRQYALALEAQLFEIAPEALALDGPRHRLALQPPRRHADRVEIHRQPDDPAHRDRRKDAGERQQHTPGPPGSMHISGLGGVVTGGGKG
jgi:hypothetical protein